MWVLKLLHHRDILQLDVEVLVDALESAADLDIVLELDRDLVVDEGLEEAGCCEKVRNLPILYFPTRQALTWECGTKRWELLEIRKKEEPAIQPASRSGELSQG